MNKRKPTNPFYYSKPWRAVRVRVLERDHGMCMLCMERFMRGGVKPRTATVVHHILHLEDRPDLALDMDNLQSLCEICHNQQHPEKGMNGGSAEPPNPMHSNVRIIKI